MRYAKLIDIPNWKTLQQELIDHKNSTTESKWWCFFPDEVKRDLPNVYATFANMGLHIRQMIYFTNLQNDLSVKDSMDPRSVFIHTDREDDLSARYEHEVPLLTDFQPNFAINIPLENCEGSWTLFYELLNSNSDVYYPVYTCGGHGHADVKEVFRFELHAPAVLRINAPHGVHNPHPNPRSVATFRFYENLEGMLID